MTKESAIKWKKEIEALQQGKTIQYKDYVTTKWECTNSPQFKEGIEYRIKPEPTKRLPTIEEVEQWFLENKVFRDDFGISRIQFISLKDKEIGIDQSEFTINEFCERYTHLDGSSLYINEL